MLVPVGWLELGTQPVPFGEAMERPSGSPWGVTSVREPARSEDDRDPRPAHYASAAVLSAQIRGRRRGAEQSATKDRSLP